MSCHTLPESKNHEQWSPISHSFRESIEWDGNHVMIERHGSIHFYIYCPTNKSLTALHRKKKNGNLAKHFIHVLEEKTKRESVGLELDIVDDPPVPSMYCYEYFIDRVQSNNLNHMTAQFSSIIFLEHAVFEHDNDIQHVGYCIVNINQHKYYELE